MRERGEAGEGVRGEREAGEGVRGRGEVGEGVRGRGEVGEGAGAVLLCPDGQLVTFSVPFSELIT